MSCIERFEDKDRISTPELKLFLVPLDSHSRPYSFCSREKGQWLTFNS